MHPRYVPDTGRAGQPGQSVVPARGTVLLQSYAANGAGSALLSRKVSIPCGFSILERATFFVAVVYFPLLAQRQIGAARRPWQGGESWREAFGELQSDVASFSNLGPVCQFGDIKAHIATADDTGIVAQQVFDSMGMPTAPTEPVHVPPRQNSDFRPVCTFGTELLSLCASTDCVILNGSAPGDAEGASTCVRRADGDAPASVIDFGIVSRVLYPAIHHFTVLPPFTCQQQPLSDHNILLCVLKVPEPQVDDLEPFAGCPPARCVRWDPAKRERYVNALLTSECVSGRAHVLSQLGSGELTVEQACAAWCDIVKAAAVKVFGVSSGGGHQRVKDGRPAKRWFSHCKQEWLALRAAVRTRNIHAARAARRNQCSQEEGAFTESSGKHTSWMTASIIPGGFGQRSVAANLHVCCRT